MKKFDPTKPHNHECPTCYGSTYCCGANCEIPQRAECLSCRRVSGAVAEFDYDTLPGKSGYRKTWPGRFSVEHYTLPWHIARN
jgi:hypothetical protein